jgi:hypothetical protein
VLEEEVGVVMIAILEVVEEQEEVGMGLQVVLEVLAQPILVVEVVGVGMEEQEGVMGVQVL